MPYNISQQIYILGIDETKSNYKIMNSSLPGPYKVEETKNILKNGGIYTFNLKCQSKFDLLFDGGYKINTETYAKDIIILQNYASAGENDDYIIWTIKVLNTNEANDVEVYVKALCLPINT